MVDALLRGTIVDMYRLVTTRPIYRAFSELDRFSDDQCRLFVEQIHNKESYAGVTFIVAAVLVGVTVVTWIVSFQPIVAALADLMEGPLSGDGAELAAMGVVLAASFFSPCIVVLLSRDLVLHRFLVRRITQRLRRARCRKCGYLLLGQSLIEGFFVDCPECGSRWTLSALELDSPADLLPQLRADEKV